LSRESCGKGAEEPNLSGESGEKEEWNGSFGELNVAAQISLHGEGKTPHLRGSAAHFEDGGCVDPSNAAWPIFTGRKPTEESAGEERRKRGSRGKLPLYGRKKMEVPTAEFGIEIYQTPLALLRWVQRVRPGGGKGEKAEEKKGKKKG